MRSYAFFALLNLIGLLVLTKVCQILGFESGPSPDKSSVDLFKIGPGQAWAFVLFSAT